MLGNIGWRELIYSRLLCLLFVLKKLAIVSRCTGHVGTVSRDVVPVDLHGRLDFVKQIVSVFRDPKHSQLISLRQLERLWVVEAIIKECFEVDRFYARVFSDEHKEALLHLSRYMFIILVVKSCLRQYLLLFC